jgi:hypothetical protein
MKLADLRRLAVREQADVHFRLSNGMECVVTRQGVAQVPGLRSRPDFNLEEELARAAEFLLEPKAAPSRRLARPELEAIASASPAAAASHDHDED